MLARCAWQQCLDLQCNRYVSCVRSNHQQAASTSRPSSVVASFSSSHSLTAARVRVSCQNAREAHVLGRRKKPQTFLSLNPQELSPSPPTVQSGSSRAAAAAWHTRQAGGFNAVKRRVNAAKHGSNAVKRGWRLVTHQDDFETEEGPEFVDFDENAVDEEVDEEAGRDYDEDFEPPEGYSMALNKERGEGLAGTVPFEARVDYRINEEEFHKIQLLHADFFIRKIADKDENVYDFREIYVTAPDDDTYGIPKLIGEMPSKPLRCNKMTWDTLLIEETPVDRPRMPYYRSEEQVIKVFLVKHWKNKREDDDDFLLDFDEIYTLDGETQTVSRATVLVETPQGQARNRDEELLTINMVGDEVVFKLVPERERRTPDEVIHELQWNRSKENMEAYLQGFRDFEKSNWF